MKVLFASDLLRPPLTGVGQYARQILAGLAADSRIAQLDCTSYRGLQSAPDALHLAAQPAARGTSAVAAVGERLLESRVGSWAFDRCRRGALESALSSAAYDIVHSPTLSPMPRRRRRGAAVPFVTVHDLSHRVCPAWHPPRRVGRLENALAAIDADTWVIAVSEATRRDYLRHFPSHESRTVVIGNGLRALSGALPEPDGGVAAAPFRAPERVLCVSTIEPRKNIGTLLAAGPMLARLGLRVTLVGGRGWRCEDTMQQIAGGVAAGWLDYRGFASDDELRALYAESSVFVYPSLHEGFGLPILEALHAGCRVVAGAHSAIAEVAAGFATLVAADDLRDPGAWVLATQQALALPDDGDWRAAQRAHAASFTWSRCIEHTVAAYSRACALRR